MAKQMPRKNAPQKRNAAPQRQVPQRQAPQRQAPPPPQGYDNDMRGAMFANNRKNADNHPDYTGSCEIEGIEYWISAWKRKSKSGAPYLSLAFTEKQPAEDLGYHGQGAPLPDESDPFM